MSDVNSEVNTTYIKPKQLKTYDKNGRMIYL